MEKYFRKLLILSSDMGKLKAAKMYDDTFCNITVVDDDGNEYDISIQKNEKANEK